MVIGLLAEAVLADCERWLRIGIPIGPRDSDPDGRRARRQIAAIKRTPLNFPKDRPEPERPRRSA